MENQHLMFKRQNGTSMLKHLLTIQTVSIITVIASNILFVTEIALWFACHRNNIYLLVKPFQCGPFEIHQT